MMILIDKPPKRYTCMGVLWCMQKIAHIDLTLRFGNVFLPRCPFTPSHPLPSECLKEHLERRGQAYHLKGDVYDKP